LSFVPVLGCISFVLAFYGLALNVIAVKAVHRLDTGRAILAVLWWIPALCICAVLLVVTITLLAAPSAG